MNTKRCAVTGQVSWKNLSMHRENSPDFIRIKSMLKDTMTDLVEREEVREYIVGLASIVQLCAAEIALELKPRYPDLMLKYVGAYEVQGYANYKSNLLVERYLRVVEGCDGHITLQKRYSEGCEEWQRAYIVNKSNMVLGIWRHLAMRKNDIVSVALDNEKPVYCIDQATGDVTLLHREGSRMIKNREFIIGEPAIEFTL